MSSDAAGPLVADSVTQSLAPQPLGRVFFAGDPVKIARALLGATLVYHDGNTQLRLSGIIVETEAYDCPRDPVCTSGRFHAVRSADMAVPAGQWLFWTAYGHPLLQVSCRPEGISASVLIRAIEPLEGQALMLERRPVARPYDLTNGPAKLVYALGLKPAEHTGLAVDDPTLHILPNSPLSSEAVTQTARIGISAGKHLPWRFVVKGSRWVSPATPSMIL